MNWIETIKEILKAQNNNRLVVFVGAGVSNNSGVPTWGELVKSIAKKINYNEKCLQCKKKTCKCPMDECEDRFSFNQIEYLRIPEYYFCKVGEDKYYCTIKEILNCDCASNDIDEIILEILPNHIITTNFDQLIENASSINTNVYRTIYQDRDLLENANNRYIIKMHGDISCPSSMVLKERDYIDYEQNHPLISTFIKSLLINHTFLFVGYSLNDSNLNMIIGWINYFCKLYGVDSRPKSFLIQDNPISTFEYQRLEKSNIYAINLNDLPRDIESKIKIPEGLKYSSGRLLYCYLKCISDNKIFSQFYPIKDVLIERFETLNSYNKISHVDLIANYKLDNHKFLQNDLILYDKNQYNEVVLVLNDSSFIMNIFQRAGIRRIQLWLDEVQKYDLPKYLYPSSEIFQLYLDNDYVQIIEKYYKSLKPAEKIYFSKLIGFPEDINSLVAQDAYNIGKNDYVNLVLHKTRSHLAFLSLLYRQEEKTNELSKLINSPIAEYKESIHFLKKLFKSLGDDELKMKELLERQQDRYKYRSETFYAGHAFEKIWELQGYVYDYYYFFTQNHLPLNNFNDPKKYFSHYLEAILCSYSPISDISNGLFLPTHLMSYSLDEIDIDIVIKFNEFKSFKAWIEKYKVSSIKIREGIDIVYKFKNYCKTFYNYAKYNWMNNWIEHLRCFILLICHVELTDAEKREVYASFVSMILEFQKTNPHAITNIFEAVHWLVSYFILDDANDEKCKLIDCLLDKSIYNDISERYGAQLNNVVSQLASFASDKVKDRILKDIDSEDDATKKCYKIYEYRRLFDNKKYKEFLTNNCQKFGYRQIFNLLIENRINFNDEVFTVFEKTIIKEAGERVKSPAVKGCLDHLQICIDDCIILHLLGIMGDLSKLKPYVKWSEHLKFVLAPDSFDYSLVDLENYMWKNLIFSKNYKKYFIEHKSSILTEKLEKIFSMDLATRGEQKIVYGVLLNAEELNNFGE